MRAVLIISYFGHEKCDSNKFDKIKKVFKQIKIINQSAKDNQLLAKPWCVWAGSIHRQSEICTFESDNAVLCS